MAGRCNCSRPCNCCTTGTSTIAVSGSGSAGQCFELDVRISADDGNRTEARADGIYSSTCLLDPAGDPIEPDEDGCVQVPAPCILDLNSDPIEPDEDGCIQLPALGEIPAFGCGLRVGTEEDGDDEGSLIVATSGDWPGDDLLGVAFDGDVADGSAIFCDLDGQLRGVPDHTAVTSVLAAETVVAETLEPVETTYTSSASTAIAVTNPSPSRRMLIARWMVAVIDINSLAGSRAEIRLQERVDGGSWTTVASEEPPNSGEADIRTRVRLTQLRVEQVQAGDSSTLELRIQVVNVGSGDDPVLISAQVAARFLGVTQ